MESPKIGNNELNESAEGKKVLNELIERAIRNGVNIGSGKDGVVFKLDPDILSDEERNVLADENLFEEEVAAKILKIYNPGFGEHEYEMQEEARLLLAEERDVAHVPSAISSMNQTISEETRNFLNAHGASLNDRVEIIMMNYIDGKDLAVIMYDFVLIETGLEEDYVRDLSFELKEQLVGQEIGFELPDPNAETPEEKISAESVTFYRNEEKLLKYLKKKGFKLDPNIIQTIKNTVRILNKNGVYHNDLHKRNIMVDKSGSVFLIDFGRAGNEKRKDGISDESFYRRWEKLSFSYDEEKENEKRDFLGILQERGNRIKTNERLNSVLNGIIEDIDRNDRQALERRLALSRGKDSDFETFLTMLHLSKERLGDQDFADSFMSSISDPKRNLRPFEKKLVKQIIDNTLQ